MVVTPNNATLIVSESFIRRLVAVDIESDGSLCNRRAWAENLAPRMPKAPSGVGAAVTSVRVGHIGTPAGAVVRVRSCREGLQV